MCTLVGKRLNDGWFLGKTRDPVSWMRWDDEIKLFDTPSDTYQKLIIQNPNPQEDGYYGGINKKGVAFVATYVGVAENQVSYIRRPYVRLILDARSAKEAVQIIKSFNPKIGGNMFIADETDCFEIEGAPSTYAVQQVNKERVKTNHFLYLPYQNVSIINTKGYKEWTVARYRRASKLIHSCKSVNDIKAILTDTKNKEKCVPICATPKERTCFTHSAFIFDTKNKKAYYAQGNPLTTPFKIFSF